MSVSVDAIVILPDALVIVTLLPADKLAVEYPAASVPINNCPSVGASDKPVPHSLRQDHPHSS